MFAERLMPLPMKALSLIPVLLCPALSWGAEATGSPPAAFPSEPPTRSSFLPPPLPGALAEAGRKASAAAGLSEPAPPPAIQPPSTPQPISLDVPATLPANFHDWPRDAQMRYLQEQLDLFDLVDQIAQKRKSILASSASPAAAGGAAAPPPWMGLAAAPARPGDLLTSLEGPQTQPGIRRIHRRDGRLVAELVFPGGGLRTVKAGDRLPGGGEVLDITPDGIVLKTGLRLGGQP